MDASCVLLLLYKALSRLCIWMAGFPLLDSPLFPCQPPLLLFSLHRHLTLWVFCHQPLLIPLEKMFSPAQLAPSSPWGRGQLKTSRSSVEPSCRVSDGTSPLTLERYWGCLVMESKENNIQCLLHLRLIFTVVQEDGSISTPYRQCSLAGAIYIWLYSIQILSDYAHTHKHTATLWCQPITSLPSLPLTTLSNLSPQSMSKPSALILLLLSLLCL